MYDRTGQIIGHYRLTRLLGRGGFADVYLGEHLYLGTSAAIKVLDASLSDDETRHFQQEARTIAQLDHPHIVRIFDFGVEDQLPFLAMSYATHGSLRQIQPRGTQLPAATVVAYVQQIASALQYAHDQHLIHRDIKPENMLMGHNGEILLSDFGLAVVAQSSSRSGNIRDVSGTIAYMAPEQARGKPQPASDQYALGVVTYEWLCGKRPFSGTYEEVIVQHAFTRPPSLCEQVPALTPAIESIVMRTLEKDARLRFNSVHDFALALEQVYRSEQSVAEPTSAALPPVLNPVIPPSQTGQGRGQITEQQTQDVIYVLAWSPDKHSIAYGGHDRTVQIRSATTGACSLTYKGHTGSVTVLAWSPDGQMIASAGLDRTIHVWKVATGEHIATYDAHQGVISTLAWSPDSTCLASTCSGTDNSIHVWNAITGQQQLIYQGHTYWVRALCWSPNGKVIASGTWREIQIWDSAQGRKHLSYRGHRNWVRSIAWSPHTRRIASAGEDNTVQIWEPLNKGHVVTQYHGHNDWINTVLWSPDGKWLATTGKDHTVHIWEAEDPDNASIQHIRTSAAYAITWLSDSKHVVSANGKGSVQVWQTHTSDT
jgi:serine/threonine protein kinase